MSRHNASSHQAAAGQRTAARAASYAQRTRRSLSRVLEGDSSSDRFMKAALGATCASIGLTLLRSTPLGARISRWAPMAVFAVLYPRMVDQG